MFEWFRQRRERKEKRESDAAQNWKEWLRKQREIEEKELAEIQERCDARNAVEKPWYTVEDIVSGGKLGFYVRRHSMVYTVEKHHGQTTDWFYIKEEIGKSRLIAQFDTFEEAEAWIKAKESSDGQ